MSLVCHTIVSRYTPQQRDPITQDVKTDEDPWEMESPLGPSQRLHSRPAPFFVPASLDYDEYGMPKAPAGVHSQLPKTNSASQDVSTWYRTVTARGRAKSEEKPAMITSNPSLPATLTHSPSLQLSTNTLTPYYHSGEPSRGRDWFTSRPPQPDTSDPKPSTITDLLSRNPPPLPTEPSFKPPVFLSIGPSNKGFAMLERKGWQEGEGLGSSRVERQAKKGPNVARVLKRTFQECNTTCTNTVSGPSGRVTTALVHDRQQDVIDLTISDSDVDSARDVVDLTLSDSEDEGSQTVTSDDMSPDSVHHGTTLLTPIATTLKADRLGIGLKPRHRRSVKAKAVTHTSAALAAHIRSGNETRKSKALHRRGSRGFARARRREERERVDMLAYMKS